MKFVASIRTFASAFFHRGRVECEIDEELRAHIENRAADLERSGLPHAEAERQAKIEFGGYEAAKEQSREALGISFIESILGDIRFGLRMLRKSPGFTAIAIITLALGIGANTLLFSLFASVYLRPLPVRQPQQLVRLVQHIPRLGTVSEFPYVYYQALRDRAGSFASVFGQMPAATLAMTDPKPAEAITLRAVTGNFFRALGVHALYGRVLRPSDANHGSGTVPAVLSYGFWKERFAGNASAVHGQRIVINGHYFAVVGVMPRGFGGLSLDTAPDVWIPLRTSRSMAEVQLGLAGRLKEGANSATAEAECRTIWTPVMTDYFRRVRKLPEHSVSELVHRWRVWLEPLEHGVSVVRRQFGKIFILLLASAGVLFLILCTNIAGLFLAKGAARRHEIAVRSALGATRARLVRQMLAEGLLLAAVGAAGGLLIARAAAPFVTPALPPIRNLLGWVVPVSNNVRINAWAYLFSLALACFSALLFGLIPALAVSRRSLDPILRASRSGVTMGGRQILIISQISLCVVLLISAGLFVRTFWNLKEINPGFDASRVDVFKENVNGQAVPPALMTTLMDRVRQVPGVVSVASASIGVMQAHGISASVAAPGQQVTRADFLDANLNYISPGYFSTLGMHILAGRKFLPSDIPHGHSKSSGAAKAIVNQELAERFFPHTNAVGKFVGMGATGSIVKPEYQIIGVVSDAKYRSLREPFRPTIYLPQTNASSFMLYVRTKMPPSVLILPIRKTLASVDPALPLGEADTLGQETDSTIASERVTAVLATLFGIAAALLVCLGIYGLLAYAVAQRRREIGIRVALGAQSEEVLKLIAAQGLRLALIGTAIGIVCALAVARLVSSMLYGVRPIDPLTFAAVPLVVTVISLVACYVPARRAARLDPMTVLRQE